MPISRRDLLRRTAAASIFLGFESLGSANPRRSDPPRALTEKKALGAITPFGGLAFLIGWVCIAVAAWNAMPRK